MFTGIGIISYPLTLTIKNFIAHEKVIRELKEEDKELPKIEADQEIKEAQQYNAALAQSGQYLIGQGASDFISSGSNNGVTKSPAYMKYLSILNGQNDDEIENNKHYQTLGCVVVQTDQVFGHKHEVHETDGRKHAGFLQQEDDVGHK